MNKVNIVWHNPEEISEAVATKIYSYTNLDQFEDRSNYQVLDFGCGKGRYMQVFSEWIPKQNIYGCDVDLESVTETIQRGFQALLLDLNYAALPYRDQTFDLIFTSNVIEHIPHDLYLVYLQEFHRVLRPGGYLLIGAPNYPIKRLYDMVKAYQNPKYRNYYLFDDPTHCNKQSVYQVEKDLEPYFTDIQLDPSKIFFERKFSRLRNDDVRYKYRIFGNKFFGKAVRKDESQR